MQKKTKRTLAWIFIPLVVLLFLFLVLTPLFKNFVKEKIAEQLKGVVQYDDLDISFLERSLKFSGLNWVSAKNKDTTQIGSVEEVFLGEFGVIPYFFGNKVVEFDRIALNNVRIDFYPAVEDSSESVPFKPYDLIKEQLHSLNIGTFSVKDANLSWMDHERTEVSNLKGVQLTLHNITLDSLSAANNNGWFSTENIQMEAEGSMMMMAKKLHKVTSGKINISSDNQRLQVDSIAIIPLYAKNELAQAYGYQTGWMESRISKILFSGFELEQLIYHQNLHASRMDIEGFDYRAFREKAIAYHPDEYSMLPHMAFKEIGIPVTIDTVIAKNVYFQYEEHVPPAKKNGLVYFNNVDMYISNLSNSNGENIKMHATADVFGQAKLKADFSFPMGNKSGLHYVQGSAGAIDLTTLNQAFEPLAFLRIQSGQLKQLDFKFQADNFSSSGDILFQYENLKIKILDKENVEKKGLLTEIGSFLANKVVLHNKNTKKKGETYSDKAEKIAFERDARKSVFNYWWKSIFSGMQSTAVRGNVNFEDKQSPKN